MTQKERILEYLETHDSITPMEAWNELGITKLATQISEMRRKQGIAFKREMVRMNNRWGEPVRFMRYQLIKEEDDE